MAIYFIRLISSQASVYHCQLHPLQAANCYRNSRLVVDEDRNSRLVVDEDDLKRVEK